VAEYSEVSGPRVECSHFNQYDRTERIAFFSDDLGEDIPVFLDDIAEGCYSFNCPLCKEPIEACASLRTGHYHVATTCRHFVAIDKNEDDTLAAEFQDDYGEIHLVNLELI
jgi:hypothetical protein